MREVVRNGEKNPTEWGGKEEKHEEREKGQLRWKRLREKCKKCVVKTDISETDKTEK